MNRADVEICQFGELFLSQIPGIPLPANIRAESLQFGRQFRSGRHAVLRRIIDVDWNGAIGRKILNVQRMLENLFKNAKTDAEVYGATAVVIFLGLVAFIGVLFLFFIAYTLLTM